MYRKTIYNQYPYLEKNITESNIPKSILWHEKVVLKYLPSDRNTKILELGCGNGSFLGLLRKKGYTNVVGVDNSPAQVEIGRKLGIDIIQQDIFTYLRNIRETSFQVIIAFDLLEHFNKEEVLELSGLILKNLKKGGFFIFKTLNGESVFSGVYRYADLTHELSFTRRSIEQIFIGTGFREIKCSPVKPVIHGLKSLIRVILWYFIDKILKLYLLIETGSCKDYILTQNLWGIAWK